LRPTPKIPSGKKSFVTMQRRKPISARSRKRYESILISPSFRISTNFDLQGLAGKETGEPSRLENRLIPP
jgi:hypothetical protein